MELSNEKEKVIEKELEKYNNSSNLVSSEKELTFGLDIRKHFVLHVYSCWNPNKRTIVKNNYSPVKVEKDLPAFMLLANFCGVNLYVEIKQKRSQNNSIAIQRIMLIDGQEKFIPILTSNENDNSKLSEEITKNITINVSTCKCQHKHKQLLQQKGEYSLIHQELLLNFQYICIPPIASDNYKIPL